MTNIYLNVKFLRETDEDKEKEPKTDHVFF